MPRKDGFDTNAEMLADFNTQAHEVFLAAYERHNKDGLPDAYVGKPLNALGLVITRYPSLDDPIEDQNDRLRRQSLEVRPLTVLNAEIMRDHLTMRHLPEDVLEHYAATARELGRVSLSPDLELRTIVPVRGIIADYTARLTDSAGGPTRHVGTLKEKPTKLSLALAKVFAGEAADYVTSDEFDLSARRGASLARIWSDTTHRFSLQIRPDVPLNGHESEEWLNGYANTMLGLVASHGNRLERMKARGYTEKLLDFEQTAYTAALTAYQRAEAILKQK